MHNKRILIAVAFVLFVLSGVAGYFGPGMYEAHRAATIRQGFIAPVMPKEIVSGFAADFADMLEATEPHFLPDTPLLKIGGGEAKITDFAGKPTLVNLWATWCTPCVVELPALDKLRQHYEGRMNVIAITIENARTPAAIADFLNKRMLSDFAGYIDKSGTFMQNLGIRGIPTSFLIGSNGQIMYRFEGDADWTSEESRAFFDAFLLQNK